MRTFLAIVIFLGGILALNPTADAARKARRSAKPPYYYYYYAPQRYDSSEQSLCEERARNEDPAGQYAGYPCWAREIFGRGSNSGGRGG